MPILKTFKSYKTKIVVIVSAFQLSAQKEKETNNKKVIYKTLYTVCHRKNGDEWNLFVESKCEYVVVDKILTCQFSIRKTKQNKKKKS